MSHGDSRTTASMVGLKMEAAGAEASPLPDPAFAPPRPPAARLPARPPQPKMTRSASSSIAASTIPSAARRPIRTTGRTCVPSGA